MAEDDYLDLKPSAIETAWLKLHELTYYIGRWQVLSANPLTVADSAHNAEGLGPVIGLLNELNAYRKGHQHFVLGVVNDKDLHRVLPLFPTNGSYYFVKADIPRGLPAEELMDAAAEYGLVGTDYSTVSKGLAAARKAARSHDIIFIGGSVFTVAEAL